MRNVLSFRYKFKILPQLILLSALNLIFFYMNRALVLTRILEIPILSVFPQFVIQRKVLEPMLYQTGGTIIAGQLALIHGWAINLGGVSI